MTNAVKTIKNHFSKTISKANAVLSDTRGDLATNTIGGIIVAVVIIGLLIVAVNAFFPGFFGYVQQDGTKAQQQLVRR